MKSPFGSSVAPAAHSKPRLLVMLRHLRAQLLGKRRCDPLWPLDGLRSIAPARLVTKNERDDNYVNKHGDNFTK
jgi:hypothetical protein